MLKLNFLILFTLSLFSVFYNFDTTAKSIASKIDGKKFRVVESNSFLKTGEIFTVVSKIKEDRTLYFICQEPTNQLSLDQDHKVSFDGINLYFEYSGEPVSLRIV